MSATEERRQEFHAVCTLWAIAFSAVMENFDKHQQEALEEGRKLEREECAKIADGRSKMPNLDPADNDMNSEASIIARMIRERTTG